MVVFKGFSTNNRGPANSNLYDIDLVKQDLLNHFFTRKGERLMEPNFGFIGWDLLFDPMTESLKQSIIDDSFNIIALDPRIDLQRVQIDEFDHGIRLQLDLLYIPTGTLDTLTVEFDRRRLEVN